MIILRPWLALVLFAGAAARAATPSYSATGFRNACDLASGPFAPNTVVSIYGSGLAWSTLGLTADDVRGGSLPTTLNGVEVAVDGAPTPLFLVSDSQINFLMPTNQIAGPVTIRVIREGTVGPEVSLTLLDAAPALFASPTAPGYAIAQQWPDYSTITPSAPAHPGGIVILYAAGLGRTSPYPSQSTEIPAYAGVLQAMTDFHVYLDGKPLDSAKVLYAGLAPGWSGLYQVNLVLPGDAGPDPEIRLAIGAQMSAPGIKLAVQ
ncbi:MAG: IPT/TIG domain-containing protein [Bryobacteraceae bacterium]|jgi:uncharacterized protein (TIGR03437 family)